MVNQKRPIVKKFFTIFACAIQCDYAKHTAALDEQAVWKANQELCFELSCRICEGA
jgi:hypothetical protein